MSDVVAPRSYRLLFWSLVLIGATADLWTKSAVFAWLKPREEYVIIKDVFSLVHQERLNKGALFGIGNDIENREISNTIFTAVAGIVTLVIIGWSFYRPSASDFTLNFGLGFVLAGAIGNLFDRVFHGGVRDFIWVRNMVNGQQFFRFDWPVFNVADCCLVCGASLLMIQAVFAKRAPVEAAAAQAQQATGVTAAS